MAQEPWKSRASCKGYVSLPFIWSQFPERVIKAFDLQRPWHSKIRLPIEADQDQGADFCHLESYDLDCLIILIRVCLGLGFSPKLDSYQNSIMTCVQHHFGQDRQTDYQVKGVLVSKLFPDDLDNMQVLRSKLTFENLLKHPGVKEVVFACPSFTLKDRLLIISGQGLELSRDIESIQESSYEDMVDKNEVKWDGIKDLGQTVADQSYDLDLEAENGTKISRRYCLLPQFIRVSFIPNKDHPRNFDDVLRFQLKAPTLQREKDMVREVMSDSTYFLCAVVKVDPKDPIGNPAEIRAYGVDGKMIKPLLPSNNNQRDAIDRKLKPDSRWTTGDPQFKFILFYRKWTARGDEVHFPIQVSPAEYRSPSPVYHFYLPKPAPPEPSTF
ncbi:hypothetical protein F4823DRAFT_629622 [Ustulina deusta]|nr:hypothetical protein F4823DRAFT_629622 [Ustulina deusta]